MVTFGGERNYLQPALSCDTVSSLLPSGWSECFSFWSGGAAFPFLVTLVENGVVFSEHCPRATKGVSALCSDAYSDTAPVLSSVLAVILHCAFPKVFQSSCNSLSLCLKSLGWVLGADVFDGYSLSCFWGTYGVWCSFLVGIEVCFVLMGKEQAVQRHACEFASSQVHTQRSYSSELFFLI